MATKKALTRQEIEDLVERLSTVKKPEFTTHTDRKNIDLTKEEAEQMFERLSIRNRRVSSAPAPNRGQARSAIDIDEIVDRLATVKSYDAGPPTDQNGAKAVKLSKAGLQELVSRLSNKELALEKTPDTKRIVDKKFGIVSSYAWNGNNMQAILCNEESP